MTNDLPIHLGRDMADIPVPIHQHHLDGLCALIHYCDGVEKSGKGRVPGSFELVMHYRAIRTRVAGIAKDTAQ